MTYDLTQLSSEALALELPRRAAHDRESTAVLLAYIAEFDARHLYLPAGFPSMFAYCVDFLKLSEDDAYKKIHVARTAHQFPQLYVAIEQGRIHLSGARMLAPYLARDNAEELIQAASHLKRLDLEILIAGRFPQAEPLRLDEGISALPSPPTREVEQAPGPVQVETASAPAPPATVKPIAAQRFSLQVTLEGATHDKLRRAQDLLSHTTRDVAEVLDRALSALIDKLEKRRFAKTDSPRPAQPSTRPRHIPAHVKRAVYIRDAGRCVFVTEDGRRCAATEHLEFDHIVPVALGGTATVDNLRLLCGPHNQFMADLAFGNEFMTQKRRE